VRTNGVVLIQVVVSVDLCCVMVNSECFECDCVACSEDQWRCSNTSRCISGSLLCNGYNDCGDDSDERNCGK